MATAVFRRIASPLRTIFAFLVAPAASAIVPAIWGLTFEDSWRNAYQAGGLGLWVAYVFGLPLGVIAYFALRYVQWRSLRIYAATGFVLAVLLFEVAWGGPMRFLIWNFQNHQVWEVIPGLLQSEGISGFAGLLGALVFWFIARPDHSHSASPSR